MYICIKGYSDLSVSNSPPAPTPIHYLSSPLRLHLLLSIIYPVPSALKCQASRLIRFSDSFWVQTFGEEKLVTCSNN